MHSKAVFAWFDCVLFLFPISIGCKMYAWPWLHESPIGAASCQLWMANDAMQAAPHTVLYSSDIGLAFSLASYPQNVKMHDVIWCAARFGHNDIFEAEPKVMEFWKNVANSCHVFTGTNTWCYERTLVLHYANGVVWIMFRLLQNRVGKQPNHFCLAFHTKVLQM